MKRISISKLQYNRTRRIQEELIDVLKCYEAQGEKFTAYDLHDLEGDENPAHFNKVAILNQMVKEKFINETQYGQDSTAARTCYSINYNYFV